MIDIHNWLDNPILRHHEFPITSSKTFLAHAAVSPHFYNTDEEIFQFLDNIPEVTSKG